MPAITRPERKQEKTAGDPVGFLKRGVQMVIRRYALQKPLFAPDAQGEGNIATLHLPTNGRGGWKNSHTAWNHDQEQKAKVREVNDNPA